MGSKLCGSRAAADELCVLLALHRRKIHHGMDRRHIPGGIVQFLWLYKTVEDAVIQCFVCFFPT